MSETRVVSLGPELFKFTSFANWVAKARSRFAAHGVRTGDVICLDGLGRICTNGTDFHSAGKDKAYPIRVYALREDTRNA